MYTGALENYPALVNQLARGRPLYGIGGDSLRAVRDPVQLADVVRAAGFPVPRCIASSAGVRSDGSWLSKPLASAGGSGIVGHAVHGDSTPVPTPRYFQERIDGLPAIAVYLGTANGALCLGVTRQLLGLRWCGTGIRESDHYRYCGSIGPLQLEPQLKQRFRQLGEAIAQPSTSSGFSVSTSSSAKTRFGRSKSIRVIPHPLKSSNGRTISAPFGFTLKLVRHMSDACRRNLNRRKQRKQSILIVRISLVRRFSMRQQTLS